MTRSLDDAQTLLDRYELDPNAGKMLRKLSDCEKALDEQWDAYDVSDITFFLPYYHYNRKQNYRARTQEQI